LLNVAREQFAQSGYAGTSMNDIAQGVGLRKSSLFHHFDTKNRLYREVVLGIVRDLARKVQEAAAYEGSYRERLDHLSYSVVDFLSAQPWAALLVVREALDERLFAEEEGLASVGDALQRVARFLEAGMKDRIFTRTDPRRLAFSIVSVHLLYFAASGVVTPFLGGDILDPESLAQHKECVAAHIRGMCGLPPDE